MVESSKILTVSYGTFSCTLEGFEDSFATMKAIAEYFRDLAAGDRYFGAVPPQPDVEMLSRIAEREIARRVEARMAGDGMGVVLRAAEPAAPAVSAENKVFDAAKAPVAPVAQAEAPAAAPQADAQPAMPPAAQRPTAAPAIASTVAAAASLAAGKAASDAEGATVPPAAQFEGMDVARLDAATIPAEGDSVAAKLARIRAVVGQTPAALEPEVYAEDLTEIVTRDRSTRAATPEETGNTAREDIVQDDAAAPAMVETETEDEMADMGDTAPAFAADAWNDDADDRAAHAADADSAEDEAHAEDEVPSVAAQGADDDAEDAPADLETMDIVADGMIAADVDGDLIAQADDADDLIARDDTDAHATTDDADDLIAADDAEDDIAEATAEIAAMAPFIDDTPDEEDGDTASDVSVAALRAAMDAADAAEANILADAGDTGETADRDTTARSADDDDDFAFHDEIATPEDLADLAALDGIDADDVIAHDDAVEPARSNVDDAALAAALAAANDDLVETSARAGEMDEDDVDAVDEPVARRPSIRARILRLARPKIFQSAPQKDEDDEPVTDAIDEDDIRSDVATESALLTAIASRVRNKPAPAETENDTEAAEMPKRLAPLTLTAADQVLPGTDSRATAPEASYEDDALDAIAEDVREEFDGDLEDTLADDDLAWDDDSDAADAGDEALTDDDESLGIAALDGADELDAFADVDEVELPEDEEEALQSELAAVAQDAQDSRSARQGRDVLPDADDAMSRIMDKADRQMSEPEGNRRRNAIAQLRAAVAATEAARQLGDRGESAETAENAFRDDLEQAVRPRRASSLPRTEARTERPRPAPLKLVASQRVDAPALRVTPVQPRRVSSSDTADQSDASSFAAFAEKMGAKNLPDLLEAAAAYTAFVEGIEDFSRPQIMKKVQATATESFSREDGLRSFGTLLRQGRISKVRNGRFQVAEDTRFKPEQRAG